MVWDNGAMAKAPTRAVQVLIDAAVPHQLQKFDAGQDHFGQQAAEALRVAPALILKTLVISTDRGLAVCCLPVSAQLNLKKAAAGFGARKAVMADPKAAQRSSGYITGGISPLGQKTALPTLIDASVAEEALIYVSGGRRGLDISLAPADLARLCQADFTDLQR
ncbi:Cys-tRNA(Pro) deacylase [Corynebacterium sp. A21]|uniref:Cys-tRNA(Pro) deacylase n=1 Tax=Corynebacterium sp. A21 TaxID=3457318 RepID=UPI003FD462C7